MNLKAVTLISPKTAKYSESRVIQNTISMSWRSFITMIRNPPEFFDVTIQPILFTIMFAEVFGGAISGDVTKYLPIIVPGLLVINCLTTCQSVGIGIREDLDKGVFDRFRSLPISRIAPIFGPMITDILRYLICSVLTIATGAFLGYRPANGWMSVIPAILLVVFCSWAISWIFALIGIIFPSASSVSSFAVIVLFPLTFLSNALIPFDSLKGVTRTIVEHNPISHIISATKNILDNSSSSHEILLALTGSITVLLIASFLTIFIYSKKGK